MVSGGCATQDAGMHSQSTLLRWPLDPVIVPLRPPALPRERADWPSNMVALRGSGGPGPGPGWGGAGADGPPAAA